MERPALPQSSWGRQRESSRQRPRDPGCGPPEEGIRDKKPLLVRGPISALHPVTQARVLGVIQAFSFPSPNPLRPGQHHIWDSAPHPDLHGSLPAGASDLGFPFLLVPYPVTRIIFLKFKSDLTAPGSKVFLWFLVTEASCMRPSLFPPLRNSLPYSCLRHLFPSMVFSRYLGPSPASDLHCYYSNHLEYSLPCSES